MNKEYNELEDNLFKIKTYLFYSKKIIYGLIPTIIFSSIVFVNLMLHFSLDFKSIIIPISLSAFISIIGETYIYKEMKKRKQSKINLKLIEDEITRLKQIASVKEKAIIPEIKENNHFIKANNKSTEETRAEIKTRADKVLKRKRSLKTKNK